MVDIATVGGEIVSAPNQIVSHALLEAADLIRTLKIVLDGKCAVTQVRLEGSRNGYLLRRKPATAK
ncbi:hypothetical protein HFO41_25715 [Rhizobium leguminosarum]|uniref:hypothetical protein n=1 Tax=Rhizobium TaxID=379 RepID=UPI001A910399|nr:MULTISPECIES: hypothetical protein [Rhizobium]MBY3214348.1 hypothetical protein [Rhizobium laguerreae]MBY5556365.1 hypothetical protein [Rhizobium leguminosarum]MBY5638138.1 hypothetical protein [Rhizobium leguminosarum]MBY5692183.1 hypothetical protein [Rhizobium leguminosarum]MBY5726127.1 hypothetical protein [Rhizobium leguminosarum]